MLWLLLKSACRALRYSLSSALTPSSEYSGLEVGRWHNWNSWPDPSKGMCMNIYHMVSCSAIKLRERRRKRRCFLLWWLSFQVTLMPCLLGYGITSCQWEIVTEFLVLLCLHAQLSVFLLNCLYLDPWVFSSSSYFFSASLGKGEEVKGCFFGFWPGSTYHHSKIAFIGRNFLWKS